MGQVLKCLAQGDDMVVRKFLDTLTPIEVPGLPDGCELELTDAELKDASGDGDAAHMSLKGFDLECVELTGSGSVDIPFMGAQEVSVTVTVSIHKELVTPACEVHVLGFETDNEMANQVIQGLGVEDMLKENLEESINETIQKHGGDAVDDEGED
eukprot:gnl/MRDRNA2_/MRDRNA2_33045_c0_seq1.p1 gnl/MRDRNA2_/MRDRNA2_33045_c0~~gnl/MRDRNA2_/MRDRNA2_33045_c0_seq1.p1  ORF type:complete len:155 (+),score=37.49 gnl/MRDRNA2_/MRDRNA2_33045_c0_seq1:99-563(+)